MASRSKSSFRTLTRKACRERENDSPNPGLSRWERVSNYADYTDETSLKWKSDFPSPIETEEGVLDSSAIPDISKRKRLEKTICVDNQHEQRRIRRVT